MIFTYLILAIILIVCCLFYSLKAYQEVQASAKVKPCRLLIRLPDGRYIGHGLWDKKIKSNSEPIDIVYTWVDGNNPTRKKNKNKYLKKINKDLINFDSIGQYRDINRDDIKYSLRSVEKYASWIRKIFIVTNEPLPKWYNPNNKKIIIINDKQIFKNTTDLPTFNSHAVESNIDNIPGLSENFIYLNDDMFFGNYVTKNDFFKNGKGILHYENWSYNLSKNNTKEKAYITAHKNNNILLNTIKNEKRRCLVHQAQPCNKSMIKLSKKLFPEAYKRTSASKFRDITNITPISLSVYVGKYNNKFIDGKFISRIYIPLKIGKKNILTLLNLVKNKKPKLFCINDVSEYKYDCEKEILEFYENYFSEKSSFEI